MKRQLPRRHDLAPLLKFKQPTWSRKERRLAKALTVEDLRRIAKRRTPKAAFDYTDGAADGRTVVPATGSSSTCGRTATGRWRWSTAPRRRGSTRCW